VTLRATASPASDRRGRAVADYVAAGSDRS
jgi:hypothetical protein